MTDNELLLAMSDLLDKKLQPIKDDLQTTKDDLRNVKDDLEIVKRDVKHLKKKAISLQAMDEAILDEVERVHGILDKHKENKTVHTA